jgi:hypothetical protein
LDFITVVAIQRRKLAQDDEAAKRTYLDDISIYSNASQFDAPAEATIRQSKSRLKGIFEFIENPEHG